MRKLRPGHILTVRNGVLKEERFWNIATGPLAETSKSRSFEETKATLFQTLEEAVCSQMIADVPLGAFLSGGIDSSIIVGLLWAHVSIAAGFGYAAVLTLAGALFLLLVPTRNLR